MFQSLPTCVLQQPNTRQSNFVPRVHRIPWNRTQATGLMNVSVKLSDEVLNSPCQFEQAMGAVAPLSCGFYIDLPVHDQIALFPVARYLLGPFAQVCQSLYTSRCCPALIHSWFCFVGMRDATRFASNSSATGSGSRKFRSTFFQARFCCYRLFIFRQLEHSSHRNMCRYAGGSQQADVTERVLGDTIRKHCIDSASRTADASATTGARSGHPPTSMAARTAKERCGATLRSVRIMMGAAPSTARNRNVSLSSCSFCLSLSDCPQHQNVRTGR